MPLEDLRFAAKMRDLMVTISEAAINRLRPTDSFATVTSVDSTRLLAYVTYPGETLPVPIAFGPHLQPVAGDRVRISGPPSDRHVSEIMSGWINWTSSFEVVGGSIGNGSKYFDYRLDGDMCDWRLSYVLGSTTAWPAGGIHFPMPFAAAAGPSGVPPIGEMFGDDVSAVQTTSALVYWLGTAAFMYGPPTITLAVGTSGMLTWAHDGSVPANSWPFVVGTARVAWAAGDGFHGHGRFRIAT